MTMMKSKALRNASVSIESQRVLRDIVRTVAYDNPGEEWGVEALEKIEKHTKGVLSADEATFARNVWISRQMDIAAP